MNPASKAAWDARRAYAQSLLALRELEARQRASTRRWTLAAFGLALAIAEGLALYAL